MPALLSTIVPFVLMFGIMYLILILPEKKRSKKYKEMLSSLSVNDEIVTRGGIVGKIISIDEEYIVLQSGPDRARLKMTRAAISQKLNNKES